MTNPKVSYREEIYTYGCFDCKEEHRAEENHKGFFHRAFCSYSNMETTTSAKNDYWYKRVFTFPCGYEKTIYRIRLEDNKEPK